ncbi:MAG: hypothetical protein U9N73_12865, partial [Candidatus Auribacterota bacterium]|nr:hypothetical protein [Candidatus Auribacterota bacterium]
GYRASRKARCPWFTECLHVHGGSRSGNAILFSILKGIVQILTIEHIGIPMDIGKIKKEKYIQISESRYQGGDDNLFIF